MYQPADCAALGLDLHPTGAGRFRGCGGKRDWRLMPDTFVISMVERGAALERFRGGEMTLRRGDVVLLWPDRWHELTEIGRLSTLWLNLAGRRAGMLASAFAVTEREPIARPTDIQAAARHLRHLVDGVNDPRPLAPSRFYHHLFALADLCAGDRWRGTAPVRTSLADRAEAVWHQETLASLSAGELAVRLGVHPNTLLAAVRTERGTTAARLVSRWRIERACRLLDPAVGGSPLKLSAVATTCGFSSLSHFIHAFRGVTGRSPGDYRRGGS